ncbi:MAG TPA: hypothetical protein VF230_15060, partial [Acidimicrobiales bacterium]
MSHLKGIGKALAMKNRHGIEAAADSFAWIAALVTATVFRYEFALDRIDVAGLFTFAPLIALLHFVAGWGVGLYNGRWRFGSFDEVAALAKAAAITSFGALGLNLLVSTSAASQFVPRTVPLVAGAMALVFMSSVRYVWRL